MAVAVMRDVDFLIASRSGNLLLPDRPLIYRYSTGVLRSPMIVALRRLSKAHGHMLVPGKLPLHSGFAEKHPLLDDYDPLFFFDWSKNTTKTLTKYTLDYSLALLADNLDRPGFHFVKHESFVGRHRGWEAIEREALLVEEPAITRESLQAVLRYLMMTTNLAPGATLLGQSGFVDSFSGPIEASVTLPEVMQAFEERVLLCTDPKTHRYDAARYRLHIMQRQGRRTLLPHLRDLTAFRRERDLVDLLCGFDERRAECGWSSHRLVAELFQLTGRLLEPEIDRHREPSAARSRVAVHRVTEGVILWAALVLAWEDALTRSVREDAVGYRRGPDLIVPALSGLGRDFLAREGLAEADDPMDGRWSAVARTLGRCGLVDDEDPGGPLATGRAQLVQELAVALDRVGENGPDWFGSLRAQVRQACDCLDDKLQRDAAREAGKATAQRRERPFIWTPAPSPLHQTFATVVGREHAVAGLRRHARDRGPGVDLLLHGPDGVGKRTLAWSYARMVLCTQPQPDGSACAGCDSCRAFETGDSGCIPVNGNRSDIGAITDQIVERVHKQGLLTTRYVFVIENADRYPPEEFDKLLKPLEDSEWAGFVLLAQDRREVRLAGQSRCFDYRVRPLDRTESREFLWKIGGGQSSQFDDAVLDLLIDVGAGLPGRLQEAWARVSADVPPDLVAMRGALGLAWGEALVAVWPAVVAGLPAVLDELVEKSDVDRAEWVRRIRAILHGVYLERVLGCMGAHAAVDPAVRHLSGPMRSEFAAVVARQAVQTRTTAEAVWGRLAEVWMSDRAPLG